MMTHQVLPIHHILVWFADFVIAWVRELGVTFLDCEKSYTSSCIDTAIELESLVVDR